jgi:hypothetical protein
MLVKSPYVQIKITIFPGQIIFMTRDDNRHDRPILGAKK